MSNDLTGILDECLDRLQAGESEADCLARYPAYAAELAPMFAAAALISGGLHAARLSSAQRLQAKSALRQAAAAHENRRGARWWSPAWLSRGLMPAKAGGLASAAIVAAFVLLAGTGTAVAASQPGDWAYGMRVVVERVPAFIQVNLQARAEAELAVADRRMADVRAELSRNGRVDGRTLSALLAGDETAARAAAGLGPEARAEIAAAIEAHARALAGLSHSAVPASAQPALDRAAARVGAASQEAGPESLQAGESGTPIAAETPTAVGSTSNVAPAAGASAAAETLEAGSGSQQGGQAILPAAESTSTITPTHPGRAPAVPPGQAVLTEPAPRRGNPPPGRGAGVAATAQAGAGAPAAPHAVPGPPGQTLKPDRTPPGQAGRETPNLTQPNRGGAKEKKIPHGMQTPTPRQ